VFDQVSLFNNCCFWAGYRALFLASVTEISSTVDGLVIRDEELSIVIRHRMEMQKLNFFSPVSVA
jgi:hypothetical protein